MQYLQFFFFFWRLEKTTVYFTTAAANMIAVPCKNNSYPSIFGTICHAKITNFHVLLGFCMINQFKLVQFSVILQKFTQNQQTFFSHYCTIVSLLLIFHKNGQTYWAQATANSYLKEAMAHASTSLLDQPYLMSSYCTLSMWEVTIIKLFKFFKE